MKKILKLVGTWDCPAADSLTLSNENESEVTHSRIERTAAKYVLVFFGFLFNVTNFLSELL